MPHLLESADTADTAGVTAGTADTAESQNERGVPGPRPPPGPPPPYAKPHEPADTRRTDMASQRRELAAVQTQLSSTRSSLAQQRQQQQSERQQQSAQYGQQHAFRSGGASNIRGANNSHARSSAPHAAVASSAAPTPDPPKFTMADANARAQHLVTLFGQGKITQELLDVGLAAIPAAAAPPTPARLNGPRKRPREEEDAGDQTGDVEAESLLPAGLLNDDEGGGGGGEERSNEGRGGSSDSHEYAYDRSGGDRNGGDRFTEGGGSSRGNRNDVEDDRQGPHNDLDKCHWCSRVIVTFSKRQLKPKRGEDGLMRKPKCTDCAAAWNEPMSNEEQNRVRSSLSNLDISTRYEFSDLSIRVSQSHTTNLSALASCWIHPLRPTILVEWEKLSRCSTRDPAWSQRTLPISNAQGYPPPRQKKCSTTLKLARASNARSFY